MRKLNSTNGIVPSGPVVGKSLGNLLFATALSCVLTVSAANQSNRDVDEGVSALLGQMTLDEKIGQMTQVEMGALKNKSDIQKYSLGSVLSGGSSDPADNSLESWLKAVANSTGKNPGLIYVI